MWSDHMMLVAVLWLSGKATVSNKMQATIIFDIFWDFVSNAMLSLKSKCGIFYQESGNGFYFSRKFPSNAIWHPWKFPENQRMNSGRVYAAIPMLRILLLCIRHNVDIIFYECGTICALQLYNEIWNFLVKSHKSYQER